MIRILAALAAALLLASTAAQAQQRSRLDDIVKRGTLRVGMTGDYLPFSYLDKATQQFRGFDVDMAEALGNALGVKVQYVQTAWPQLMKDFEADHFDIAMGGISITPDREKKGPFSTPIMREGKTPIARCADKDKYDTIAEIDRPGTRVIVNPGGTNERFARANIKTAEIKTWNDNVTIFDENRQGRRRPDDDGRLGDAIPAKASSRRAVRRASRPAVRFCREGLLVAARRRAEGLRRPMAAHGRRRRQHPENLCGLV